MMCKLYRTQISVSINKVLLEQIHSFIVYTCVHIMMTIK